LIDNEDNILLNAGLDIDVAIYRTNGSLRISSEDMFYNPSFDIITIDTDKKLSKLK
jgi:hypothetical protein